MPVSAAGLIAGANYQLQSYAKNDPIDQFSKERPLAKWFLDHSENGIFGNGIFNEKVRLSNDSNFQSYTGDDQVTYNRRDTVRMAQYKHYEQHDGFGLNETELADNGILLTDDREAKMSGAEEIQLVNKLKENYAVLKEGFQVSWDEMLHRDGTASSLDMPGLDLFVSTTPSTTTLGGIDASTTPNAYWRNNVSLNIAATTGVLTAAMETEWRKCRTFGKKTPNGIFAGYKFIDAYRKDLRDTFSLQVNVPSRGGMSLDGATNDLYFHGVLAQWDPTMDTLQTADDPTIDWDKRCYFLQSDSIKLRKVPGRWMQNRKPNRMHDRYLHYWGLTSDSGLTLNQRNTMSVLSIV